MELLFVGRSTFDLGYVCPEYPQEDSKVSSDLFFNMAGGPALNAAVTHRALGGEAMLWTVLGGGPLSRAVQRELAELGVRYRDFAPGSADALPISSIVVVPANSSRTIFDQHPSHAVADVTEALATLSPPRLLLSDGFLPDLALPVLRWARARGVPTVLDGGWWKPWTPEFIQLIDIAIVSGHFIPPGCSGHAETIARLHDLGVAKAAITRGSEPILWSADGTGGEITPPVVDAVDTLGAGDIFHGAFCHYYSTGSAFDDALASAAEVAANSCRYWGTREWINADANGARAQDRSNRDRAG
ncbi:MAG: hypothetical protein QOK17_2773 [Sphingomonadales bacterium]|jgi:sugar/nucleoside kinase (ribokinase family)|nr:hypothetical protein [Sphingomonadales bacterium]